MASSTNAVTSRDVLAERLDLPARALRLAVAAQVERADLEAARHQRTRDVGVAPAVLVDAVDDHDDAPPLAVGRPLAGAEREAVVGGAGGGRVRHGAGGAGPGIPPHARPVLR